MITVRTYAIADTGDIGDQAARQGVGPPNHLAGRSRYYDRSPSTLCAAGPVECGSFPENWSTREYWDSDVGCRDIEEHTLGRLIYSRHEYVPWLNGLRRLDGARVFEIGCGMGSSVMALIEQGAEVTGIDVALESIEVSRARLRFFGLDEPSLHHLNGTEVDAKFDHASFNFVIFFASLEHMTHGERLGSLRAAWRLLADDGILCIIEAPNRL